MKSGPDTRHLWVLAATALLAGACTRQESIREIDWAKAALARNPHYEIVATDETAGVFTVRDTASGEVTTLRLQDLIAAPRPPKQAATPVAPAPADQPVERPDVPDDTGADLLADDQTTETATDTGTLPVPPESGGSALAEGPGYRITRATGSRPEPATGTLEGPGYSIVRQDEGARNRRSANEPAASPQPANAERRTDPIICQGNRLMRIDGETLSFAGDAVIAEKGCDLYITNARIRAGGVGIIAREQARVHIVNSTIGGARGSYEASDGAEIYVARSTFTGIGRRFDGGQMTDLGGNAYETH